MKSPAYLLLVALLGAVHDPLVVTSTRAATTPRTPVKLVLDPMPAPRPALRYTFVHEVIDQTPGNAALAYQQALRLLAQNETWRTQGDQLEEWLKVPLDQLPVEAVEAVVAQYASALGRLAQATRLERCDFEVPIRQDGVNALLPHLAELRGASRLLAVEIRLRIRQGHYPDALERLKAGLTLARHTGNGATLIEGLVGVAIANLMFDRIEELVAQPGAPNLYWALSDLPPSFLNLWQATRWECCFLYVHMPALWRGRTHAATAADLQRAVREFRKFGGSGPSIPWLSEEDSATVLTTVGALAAYPRAVAYLQRQGASAEEIRQMSVPAAIATYLGESYAVQRDELFKWFALPYHEAREGLARVETGLRGLRARDPIGSVLPSLLLPALTKAASRYAASERRVALLRCVEAIRLYAAAHDRRLPASLGDIREAPIPQDPMTGDAFVYRLDGHTARLEGGPLPDADTRTSPGYELTIRR